MKDKILILKIQSYVKRVKRIYELIENMSEEDIYALDDSFALTQFLININSLFESVTSDEIASRQIEMGIRSLKTCRNIASHDYDALDWNRIKQLCKKLTSERTASLLVECLKIAEADEAKMTDYT